MNKVFSNCLRTFGIIAIVSGIAGIVAFVKERTDEKRKRKENKIFTLPNDESECENEVKKNVEPEHVQGFYEKYLKRPMDCTLAVGAVIVLSPVLVVIALLVRFKLGSPIVFIQERPGKNGKIFKLYKFRTMSTQMNESGELLPDEVRLTEFGKILRASSCDELLELVNIIKGDMAVVGPRPLLVSYLDRYNEYQYRRHEVRPGLTGLAQIHGRNAATWQAKFGYDVEYVDHISFLGDTKIIWDTIGKVIHRDGISSSTSATMEEFMGNEE